ncbi:hypothetical protein SAMN04244572_04937 [Azotobacter beijerinckii]|uniref:Uncharacterized protein n=1 Tax=Azotobacter beijerinckii TaxID=170623 RepID=A0A1H6ZWH7_9GAMM|nr:hypothetical protein [Azotobacter beijerinckii]SEJ57823.1 hypothetical protein SAMN04244579_04840 [Azotobacter beijerinckii]SEJ69792.1 hypothetical protein SAMN04244572_04937 [Azotobacter beijerinckii]
MNSVTVRKLMRAVLTLLIAACTVIFFFMMPEFFAPESDVGLLVVVFKGITLLAAWVFVYRLWKLGGGACRSD